MVPQQYCLRWKHHHSNVQSMFAQLLEKERFCDVTLYCSPSFATQVPNKDTVEPQNIRGVSLRAHRVVLAACSELLGALLGAHDALGEPVLVIDGAEPRHLRALLDYMYTGEMNVHHSQLAGLLKTAEELRIKGLTDIRWNNKDEPPDCATGAVTTTPHERTQQDKTNDTQKHEANKTDRLTDAKADVKTPDVKPQDVRPPSVKAVNVKTPDRTQDVKTNVKNVETSPSKILPDNGSDCSSPEREVKDMDYREPVAEKFNVNGGPPPLIKLPTKEKLSSPIKRDICDRDSPSPKRQRLASGTDHTDDENSSHLKTERDPEWRHGNLDITAERVVGWGAGEEEAHWSRDQSDDEWADPPADIGSFLRTKLRVDGDNSGDEESDGSACGAVAQASSSSSTTSTAHIDYIKPGKHGVVDPRFMDVVKLNDYLQHGRRPQFWEENYVKRVMEAVRVKELEMKQAAEILGVSYGTLYGRYRDVYGCINRPYRTAREFWQAKGPSGVLDRLQRGDLGIEAAALALGVMPANLAAYVADAAEKGPEFEIPLELDAGVKMRGRPYGSTNSTKHAKKQDKAPGKKVVVGSLTDEDPIPASVITTQEKAISSQPAPSGKWPTIRVASLDSLRGTEQPPSPPAGPPSPAPSPSPSPSPSQLMRTRPDLTIVAARRSDS
ncbi:uncharacterized protein LOC112049369 isoform X2 [Bicyclus anynana]|uniref:Uncharacterized protein LOC112049369 isoform X2 n=1 Tax=Bicyclus anynana TaxID=110368 RepID=A0A6J1N7Y2_BICAN|nr:uncharacterized protein LOC112049369 isoform X2 [Bicyclus anynana]